MDNPLLLVYHMFDKAHELHAVAEVMFELSVVEQLYQSLIERVCLNMLLMKASFTFDLSGTTILRSRQCRPHDRIMCVWTWYCLVSP